MSKYGSRVVKVAQPDDTYFEIVAPGQWTVPMVFNSPHSGNILPKSFLETSRLSPNALHASEDSHVDDLFMGCLAAGAPLMRALISRSFIDLNREPYEFDARMFKDVLPAHMNTTSSRVACGLGTIPKTVGEGVNIYDGPLELPEALQRIDSIYRPYHRTLSALLDEAHRATGIILLVDCHSMPSSSVTKHPSHGQIDVVLGDRFGNACDKNIVEAAAFLLRGAGLNLALNKPYAGGFITENHGRPRQGRHALQIEINRALYMNETTRRPTANYQAFKVLLDRLAMCFAEIVGNFGDVTTVQLAAE